LAKPKIREQISEVDVGIRNFPKYETILKIHKEILNIILPLDESIEKWVFFDVNEGTFEKFLNKIIISKNPLIHFLKETDFNTIILSQAVNKIVNLLLDKKEEDNKLRIFTKKLESDEKIIKDAILSIIREDSEWFKLQGKIFGSDPSLLLLIFDSPLRPFFELVARELEEKIKENWFESYCPICGRQSNIARKKKSKRYIICSYCGLEYLVDMFKCINCGNIDPTLMGFIKIEEKKEYELDYCRVCYHYIKILDENLVSGKIPYGLEDLLTRELDNFATGSDLHLVRA
jgi:formate dehydrogenase maturation protein FdhE